MSRWMENQTPSVLLSGAAFWPWLIDDAWLFRSFFSGGSLYFGEDNMNMRGFADWHLR